METEVHKIMHGVDKINIQTFFSFYNGARETEWLKIQGRY